MQLQLWRTRLKLPPTMISVQGCHVTFIAYVQAPATRIASALPPI